MKIKPTGTVLTAGELAAVRSYEDYIAAALEPSGITNEAEISLAGTSNTLNVTSTSNKVKYFYQGTYGELTTPVSKAITATIGVYFVYINNAGVLAFYAASAVPSAIWFSTVPLVAICYWNGVELMISKECHGVTMEGITHAYLHGTIGCRYQNDGGFAGSFNDTGFTLTEGTIWDEDIKFLITAKTQCRCYYRSTATWIRTTLQNEYYVLDTGNLQYDNAGTLTPVTADHYMAVWIFASNDVNAPIISILGQRTDTTLGLARANNTYESLVFGTLPAAEMKLLFRVIIRNDATPYEETQDYRTSSLVGAINSPGITHASLAGLTNDDHPQYLLRTDYLSTDDVAGIVAANDLSNTYPAITKKDLTADMIAGVAGGNTISAAYPAITKKDITSDQLAGIAGSASMSASNVAATVNDLSSQVPCGAILPFADDAVPTGYLECNGAAISRTTYSALFAIVGTTWGVGDNSTTFNIPELRGEFLRGWDNSRGIDSARAFASAQGYATNSCGWSIWARTWAGSFSVTVNAGTGDEIKTASTETRPRNIAIMYCIKY